MIYNYCFNYPANNAMFGTVKSRETWNKITHSQSLI